MGNKILPAGGNHLAGLAAGMVAILLLPVARFSVWPGVLAWPWEVRFAGALALSVGAAEWLTRRKSLYYWEGRAIALLAVIATVCAIAIGTRNGFMEPIPNTDDLGMIWIPLLVWYQIWRGIKGWGRKFLNLE